MLRLISRFLKKEKRERAKPRPASRAAQLIEILQRKHVTEAEKEKKGKRKKVSLIFPRFRVYATHRFIALPSEVKTQVRYPLIEPYAYALIRYDAREHMLTYNVIEPVLSSEEKRMLEKIKLGLISLINVPLTAIKNREELTRFLEENVQLLLDQYGFELSADQYLRIMYYIYRDFVGLNEIEPLMQDPYIEDISVDGVGLPVYVLHQKYGSMRTNIVWNDVEKLREFVVKLAERCDRYISYAEPLLDGTLPDLSLIHI